jgi:hypothetical protein
MLKDKRLTSLTKQGNNRRGHHAMRALQVHMLMLAYACGNQTYLLGIHHRDCPYVVLLDWFQ